MRGPKIQFEHPTQLAASTFLRAVSENDAAAMWEKLSRETRGLLEGLYAARSAVALQHAAGVEPTGLDARLAEVVAPLRVSVIAALGGAERMGEFGVSGARLVDRATAWSGSQVICSPSSTSRASGSSISGAPPSCRRRRSCQIRWG